MIVIVDYKLGNPESVKNMLKKVGAKAVISNDVQVIEKATKLILPGVGSFNKGMQNLKELELIVPLKDRVFNHKTPLLGICLGMQLLFEQSEEQQIETKGLGFVKGSVCYFDQSKLNTHQKVPHMGWRDIELTSQHPLFEGQDNYRFYFVHSLHAIGVQASDVLCQANYGYDFVCGVQHKNIVGLQFHPEKSHVFGMQVMKNFAEKF